MNDSYQYRAQGTSFDDFGETHMHTQEPQNVEQLITTLTNDLEDVFVRQSAVSKLGELKDPRAVKPLIAALQHWHPNIRFAAIDALGEIKDPRAAEPMLATLRNDIKVGLMATVNAIANIGTQAIDPIIVALNDQNPNIRLAAVLVLGKMQDPRAVRPLIPMLKDQNTRVRLTAAESLDTLRWTPSKKDERLYWLFASQHWTELAKMGTDAVKLLVIALKDQDHTLRWGASQALTEMGSKVGSPRSEPVKEAIHLLVELKASDALISMWNATKEVLLDDVRSGDYQTIERALYAFIGIGNPKILPDLIKALNRDGTKTTAEAYLNCGRRELADAAESWAKTHGYTISMGSGAH